MLTVVRREISNYCHQNPNCQPLEAAELVTASDTSKFDYALELDNITRHFTVLSQREEEVLLLRLQTMKYREIAQSLGISVGSVPSLLARALRKLQAFAGTHKNRSSVIRKDHAASTLR